ncbi:MAG: hypothetical protein LQ338_004425 [Usnochroma carphineum]|nr:MAG: hypothetical protein LQ338_004425 [Usnochroma carphineum]
MAALKIKVPAGKLISIPHGVISIDTNVWAQYVCCTGTVANKIVPTVKKRRATNMMYAWRIRDMSNPVVTAAQRPEMAQDPE